MTKRVLDGERVWRFDKLSHVKPAWMRAELANLLPLSLSNGVFEADARRIWSLVYSYNRSEITLKNVESILAEYDRVGVLFRWVDPQTSKIWGYWVGLPSQSRLARKHEANGPNPPAQDLKTFILKRSSQCPASGEGSSGLGSGSEEASRVSQLEMKF